MNIACNEYRERLSDALDETANPAEQSALAEHLAACDSCRAETELLRAARAQLRAFPKLAAPDDFRAQVRAQLESAPATSERLDQHFIENRSIVAPAKIHSTPDASPRRRRREPEPRPAKTWRDHLRMILNNSTAITWASCCMLLLFYFVSFSRRPKPTGAYDNIERAPVGEAYEKRFFADNGGETPAYKSPYKNEPYLKTMPKQAEPGKIPSWSTPNLPKDAFADMSKIPSGKTNIPKTVPSTSQQNHEADNKKTDKGASTPTANPKSTTTGAATNRLPAPAYSTYSNPAAQHREDADVGKDHASPAPAAQKAKSNYMARSTPDSERSPSAAGRSAAIASADDSAPTSSREITTRLTPPRSVGWGQISVVLSGNAHFANGQKSRVIWQGSAAANEPIDLSFSVIGASNAGDATITLQEVKDGQANTIAYKTVSIGASR